MSASLQSQFRKWQRAGLIVGAVGLAICILVGFFHPARAFQAYWFAWIFWIGIGFGGLSIQMLQNMVQGKWGEAIARPAEAATLTLPLMALLFVPAWFGIPHIFPWARPDFWMHGWEHKRHYLTAGWFTVRSAAYLITASALAFALCRYAHSPERRISIASSAVHPVPVGAGSTLRKLSGAGLVFYGLLVLFASTDWFMSLEPEWYSTMPVVIVMAGDFVSALSFSIIVAIALTRVGSAAGSLTVKQLHDLGNLLLAFVIFWIYVCFSQFLIIWSGDEPREISWYLHRKSGGWQYVATALALTQFAVPFALLLSRAAKQHAHRLLPIAALIFAASILNTFWLITPAFTPGRLRFPCLEFAALLGIGGLWMSTFLSFLKSSSARPTA